MENRRGCNPPSRKVSPCPCWHRHRFDEARAGKDEQDHQENACHQVHPGQNQCAPPIGRVPDPFLAGRLGRSPNPAVVTHSGLVNSDPVRHNIPRIASLKQLPWNLISPIDQSITHRPETARSLEKAREREYANPNQTESAQLHGRAALPARSRVETDRQRAKPVGL